MTPFKPFSIEIKTREEAYTLWHRLNSNDQFDALASRGETYYQKYEVPEMTYTQFCKINRDHNGPIWNRIDSALEEQSFDPRKQHPSHDTINIAGYDVEFKEGAIKIGCTTVDKATIEKILKRLR